MTDTRVSVVIPAYNAGRYISGAIESVLSQTHPGAEIIVVDDGSTDDTHARVERFGSRVRLLRQENRGVSAARNAGIREATGRWVAFLDADDLWLPEKIQRQLQRLADEPGALMACSSFRIVSEDLVPLGLHPCPSPQDLYRQLLLVGNVVGTPSTVICDRDLLLSLGGFDCSLSLCADWDLWLRLATETECDCIHPCLVDYRRHGANMSRNVRVLENDSRHLLRKAMSSSALPPALRALRRRAESHNWMVLAGSYYGAGDLRAALRCAARAAARSPLESARVFARQWSRGGVAEQA